jgi:hypothetical protein
VYLFRVKKTEYFESDLKNWKIQSGVVFKIRMRCPNNDVVFDTGPKIMNIDRTIKKLSLNSILYTKAEKFMIIARAPRLDPEARRGM